MKSFEAFGIELRGRAGVEVKTVCPRCSHTRKKKTCPCLNVNTRCQVLRRNLDLHRRPPRRILLVKKR